jgi:hypothetical protein
MMRKVILMIVLSVFTVGCAGMSKSCTQFNASSFGSDWIVAQYTTDGKAFHCWKLRGAVVEGTEGGSVDWKDTTNGHLVHLTGWENRVQVVGGDFDTAGKLVGVDASLCDSGVYPAPPKK